MGGLAMSDNTISDTVIPALPGFFLHHIVDGDISGPAEAVIAWRIIVRHIKTANDESSYSEVWPITVASYGDGRFFIEQPNGTFIGVDDTVYPDKTSAGDSLRT